MPLADQLRGERFPDWSSKILVGAQLQDQPGVQTARQSHRDIATQAQVAAHPRHKPYQADQR